LILFLNFKNLDVDLENSVDAIEEPVVNTNKRKMVTSDEIILRKQIQLFPNKIDLELNEDKFSANKRDSLKNINVNNIANMFKSRIDQFNNNNSQNNVNMHHSVNSNRPKSFNQYSAPQNNNNNNNNLNTNEMVSSIAQNLTTCYVCDKKVYLMERTNVMDLFMHANCFRCNYCVRTLRPGFYSHLKDPITQKCIYLFYFNGTLFYLKNI
jgi:hypothetical protein